MTDKQPEALRIAEELLALFGPTEIDERAAAELRRLHALNAELVEALNLTIDSIGRFTSDEGSTDRDFDILDNAIAALAKAEGK